VIRREAEASLPDLYDRAHQNADTSLRKHGEHNAADALPTACPNTLDQITGDFPSTAHRTSVLLDSRADRLSPAARC
jgi:hypothetical protein